MYARARNLFTQPEFHFFDFDKHRLRLGGGDVV